MLCRWLTAALLLCGFALGQQLATTEVFGVSYVSVADLARGLGTGATSIGSSTVVRTGFGILTVFAGEQDFLWQDSAGSGTTELRLNAPVLELAGEVWAPLSMLEQLGGTVSGIVVIMPDRTRLLLADATAEPPTLPQEPAAIAPPRAAGSATVELANGVRALRLQAQGQSMLLVDLGLLALAYPERRPELDSFNAELGGYRPLYFVLGASTPGPANLEFRLSQAGMNATLGPDDGVVILQGDPARVGPAAALSGVLLLPPTTNLRLPLQVQWLQQTGALVFRR